MIKRIFLLLAISVLWGCTSPNGDTEKSSSAQGKAPCFANNMPKDPSMHCVDSADFLKNPSWKNEENKQQMAKLLCSHISENGLEDLEDNLTNRDLLHQCVKRGYLESRSAQPEPLNIKEAIPNSLGLRFEEYNIWFYQQNPEGEQNAGINIYNPESVQISWVIIAFHPSSCYQSTPYSWAIRLTLEEPMPQQDKAIITWLQPKGLPLTDGCLDILSAG